jgi:hypothetical protein
VKLDWNNIVSNAITVLVASVFVGAAVQLWSGVQSIDSRIDSNLVQIRATQSVLAERLDSINGKLSKIMPLILFDDKPEKPPKRTKDLIDERIQQQTQRGGL